MTVSDNARETPRSSKPVRPSATVGSFGPMELLQTLTAHGRSMLERNHSELWLLGPVTLYLIVVLGVAYGSIGVLAAATILALLARFGSRISSDTMLQLYRTQEIQPNQGMSLKAGVVELSLRAGLAQPPRIAIIPSVAIGAFSVGTVRPTILLTEGLLRRFSLAEIIAILAHEISHIRAGDLQFFALADTITRFAQLLCYVGIALFILGTGTWLAGEPFVEPWVIVFLMLAPCFNSQLQLHLPRRREYRADAAAAHLLGETVTLRSVALAMEPDFGSLSDDFRLPVPQRRNPIPSPARAHLANSERVEHLAAAQLSPLMAPLHVTDEPLVSLVGVGPIELRPRNRWPGLWF